ncbi:MAG: putative isomaltodextranase, partial [Daejeonella sp.]|nr:putative isomaltodextranase [Daejeonella sp.]
MERSIASPDAFCYSHTKTPVNSLFQIFRVAVLSVLIIFSACKKQAATNIPVDPPKPPSINANDPKNPFKAPLYWSPYEYNIKTDGYIPENEWAANIDWVDKNLKDYGYKMICIDGWGDDSKYNQDGYRTTHSSKWEHDYAWWSNNLQSRGMTLGIYNNPLWIIKSAADAGVKIKGTDIPLASIMNEGENALWFKWVQVDKPGAEQYVKGYVQYYADMGVKYLRVDFLSWFENGYDRNIGTVGINRPKAQYEKALRWM